MKLLKFVAIIALINPFIACKKSILKPEPDYIEGFTRVIGVKMSTHDTSSTPFMEGRIETTGLIMVEDATLKAELIAYHQGIYTIQITNKTDCQRILRWHWEGLLIDHQSPEDDVMSPNAVITYTLTGEAKPGKIKVKAEKSNSECENSSTLVLNITNQILPIKYTSYSSKRVGEDMIVKFSTEEPENVDWFYVLWSPDGNTAHETLQNSFECDKVTKKYTVTFPAKIKDL